MDFKQVITYLKEALKADLPGTEVQWAMASSDRRIKNFPRARKQDSRLAAVLILLYPLNNKIHTLFIQRPVYKGVHSGQISFPGGKEENSDRSLIDTALREACEETAICGSDISVLGKLTPLFIPVSNIEVTPVVAWSDERPAFIASDDEVVSLIEAELAVLMSPDIVKEKPMKIRDELLDVKYYDYQGQVIWGATAMMLHELLEILRRTNLL